MSEPGFHFNRTAVAGDRGMVAASQPLAVEAGLRVLRLGGRAADAAVATAAALNVTEPTSTGLGGDCFALYFRAADLKVFSLNASGRAPAALTLEKLVLEGMGESIPPFHPYTVTVPGACAGWCDLVDRFGRLGLDQILGPAIELAQEGFPVQPITAFFWDRAAKGALGKALNGQELMISNRGPRAGEVFRNPGLARTLRLIASQGKDVFYKGEIADGIIRVVSEAGGCLAKSDLEEHTSTWDEPLSTLYRGVKVWECPPNGQGLVALIALNILAALDHPASSMSVLRVHEEIEAVRLAFADGRRHIADPSFSPEMSELLLAREYARSRAALIRPGAALDTVPAGDLKSGQDTVYFCVVDGEGNACSFINSNYMGFGTGIVPRGYGFSLQNRGHNFSLQKGHANALAPGKRPYHTIIPGMLTNAEDGRLFGVFGVMGGFMQPQGHVQILRAILDDGLDPQQALERPRFCVDADKDNSTVLTEEGMPEEVADGLRAIGHPVRQVSGMARAVFGRGQIILRDGAGGKWIGGSDPRADGCARSE